MPKCAPQLFLGWLVTRDALISYWSIFPLSRETVPEVFAKVNSTQFFRVSKVTKCRNAKKFLEKIVLS